VALKESSLLGEGIPLVPLLCQTPWKMNVWNLIKITQWKRKNHRPESKPSFSASMLIFQGVRLFSSGEVDRVIIGVNG